jgi:predicted nucleotidyltransferase
MAPQRSPAPVTAQRQLDTLVTKFRDALGDDLTGVYLHGSLAMGCFNPDLSDIDLLVRHREPLDPEIRRLIISALLSLSGKPFPIEISFLSDSNAFPWRYPTPYSLHFGEDWRERFEANDWVQNDEQVDHDLAAHITVLHERGMTLLGPPPADLFPVVPTEDYRDSILRDYRWALNRLNQNPVYAVLNISRVLRYLTEGEISSKQEAGEWALNVLQTDVHLVPLAALSYYRGERDEFRVEPEILERFVSTVEKLAAAQ